MKPMLNPLIAILAAATTTQVATNYQTVQEFQEQGLDSVPLQVLGNQEEAYQSRPLEENIAEQYSIDSNGHEYSNNANYVRAEGAIAENRIKAVVTTEISKGNNPFGNQSTLNFINKGLIGLMENPLKIQEELELVRWRWKINVVGDFDKQPELEKDEQVTTYIMKLSDEATQLYKTINKHVNRTTLWNRIPSDTNSADLTTQFRKLNKLAKAYGTKGTINLYKNRDLLETILSGLNFMIKEGRYSGTKYFGNWWDWQIGVAQNFISTLIIIFEDVEYDKIKKYADVVTKYLPNPYQQLLSKGQTASQNLDFIKNFNSSSANLVDKALSVLGLGLLTNNASKVNEAVNSINEVFETVTKGEGFYTDGSFIQHDVPYTGSYGNELIKAVGNIFFIVANTCWQAEEKTRTDFIQTVKDAFIPLIVNGETMSFVNGRSISRAKNESGSDLLYNLLIISTFGDKESKEVLRQTAKFWMIQNLDFYLTRNRDLRDILMTKELMEDASIDISTQPFLGSRVYGSMDRFVYRDSSTGVGISMYSIRTSAFEALNKENKKGWHTADGMVYLYNNDQQFGFKYWPTVDWYRLPGTTVDTRTMADETSFKPYKSREKYVGGATDKKDAVLSMQLNKAGTLNTAQAIDMNLTAKKSWFIFDGKIISLGTDINGITNSSIQTIIENRLFDESSIYDLLNQDGKIVNVMDVQDVRVFDWFLLKSSKEKQSIGYVMLDNQRIKTEKQQRKGSYKDINDAFPSDIVYTGSYQKIIIDHGNKVNGGKYAYLTYPNADKITLKSLIESQRFSILANTKEIQAVKDNWTNKLGATIWNQTGGKVEGIAVNTSATLLYREEENYRITLSVSNPKQTDEIIKIQLPQEVTNILSQDDGVEMTDNRTVVVNTKGALGKTFQFIAKVHTKAFEPTQSNEINQEPN